MGNCDFKISKNKVNETPDGISKNLFNFNFIIGRGGFGKVKNFFLFFFRN